METCIIIPARYNSKRLFGKPLINIDGEPLLLKTYNKVLKFFNKKNIYITTDSEKIEKRFKKITKNIILTKNYCLNGTERCSFAINKIKKKYKYFIITSCDMPFLNAKILIFLIKKIKTIKNNNIDGITVHTKIKDTNILRNKNIAKIILKKNQVIDFKRIIKLEKYRKRYNFFSHHGLVILKRNVLEKYKKLPNTKRQLKEDNEWLKLVENNYKINSYLYNKISPEINIKKDLKKYFPIQFKNI